MKNDPQEPARVAAAQPRFDMCSGIHTIIEWAKLCRSLGMSAVQA